MADIEIFYRDSCISEISLSGTKVLKTAGKYCESDITVLYTQAEILSLFCPSDHGDGMMAADTKDFYCEVE